MSIDGLPLVAAAVHDVKNLLASIDARLGPLCDGASPAGGEMREVRRGVLAAGRKLTRLLALLRARQGQLQIVPADTELQEFLDDVLTEARIFQAPSIALQAHTSAAAPPSWSFDRYLVGQVVVGALQNAFRYARSEVALSIAPAPGRGLAIEVSDDGPGFGAEVLEAFEAQIPRPMHAQGSGLGLSLGRAVARAHRHGAFCGEVEIANRTQGGACFRLLLP
jgi:signal transduction histidine kinase